MGGFSGALSLAESTFNAWTGPTGVGLAAWFLAGVFAISGVAKVCRPALAAMALVDFGIAHRIRPWGGRALGFGELALAVALPLFPFPAGIMAAAALWLFVVVIAGALHRGATFPCFCFGDTDHSLSRSTLARTAALAVMATVLAWSARPGRRVVGVEALLQMVVAVATLGVIVLGGRVPALLRWNSTPFGGREEVPA